MNRARYFDFIEEKLDILSRRIETRGKLNILNLHLHMEDFYAHLINEAKGWNLTNVNSIHTNTEAIDLIDDKLKIIVQVSSTCTVDKINTSLSKQEMAKYFGYTFYFLSISKNADSLRKKEFIDAHGIDFNPALNILDVISILNEIKSLPPDKLYKVYELVKQELSSVEQNEKKLESNITSAINLLSKKDLSKNLRKNNSKTFKIDIKISHNMLVEAKKLISKYAIYYGKLNKTYSEFDKMGANKSISVLNTINDIYASLMDKKSDDELYFAIKDEIIDIVYKSTNFQNTPIDEVELCVNIIMADAFIKCEIFENPNGY